MVKHTTTNANRRPKANAARDYRYFPFTYAQFARSQRYKNRHSSLLLRIVLISLQVS